MKLIKMNYAHLEDPRFNDDPRRGFFYLDVPQGVVLGAYMSEPATRTLSLGAIPSLSDILHSEPRVYGPVYSHLISCKTTERLTIIPRIFHTNPSQIIGGFDMDLQAKNDLFLVRPFGDQEAFLNLPVTVAPSNVPTWDYSSDPPFQYFPNVPNTYASQYWGCYLILL